MVRSKQTGAWVLHSCVKFIQFVLSSLGTVGEFSVSVFPTKICYRRNLKVWDSLGFPAWKCKMGCRQLIVFSAFIFQCFSPLPIHCREFYSKSVTLLVMLKISIPHWKGICVDVWMESLVCHTGIYLSFCPHLVSFLPSYLWFISGIAWLVEKPVERLHWTIEFISERPWERWLSRGSTVFNTFYSLKWHCTETWTWEVWTKLCLCKSFSLRCGDQDKHSCLVDLIPQQWAVLGGNLSGSCYILICLWWCVYFGSVRVWNDKSHE